MHLLTSRAWSLPQMLMWLNPTAAPVSLQSWINIILREVRNIIHIFHLSALHQIIL